MFLDREEYCKHCGNPTGRGGNFHDTLIAELNGEIIKPLCDDCKEQLETEGAIIGYE